MSHAILDLPICLKATLFFHWDDSRIRLNASRWHQMLILSSFKGCLYKLDFTYDEKLEVLLKGLVEVDATLG